MQPPSQAPNSVLLGIGTGALVFALPLMCCCWPIAVVLSAFATIAGFIERRQAKSRNQPSVWADMLFYLGIVMIVVSILWGVLNIVLTILYPDMLSQMMKDLGAG